MLVFPWVVHACVRACLCLCMVFFYCILYFSLFPALVFRRQRKKAQVCMCVFVCVCWTQWKTITCQYDWFTWPATSHWDKIQKCSTNHPAPQIMLCRCSGGELWGRSWWGVVGHRGGREGKTTLVCLHVWLIQLDLSAVCVTEQCGLDWAPAISGFRDVWRLPPVTYS